MWDGGDKMEVYFWVSRGEWTFCWAGGGLMEVGGSIFWVIEGM